MTDLSVKLGRLTLKNPVTVASGAYGYGAEYLTLYAPSLLGAVFLKGITPKPRAGNQPPRIVETPAGMLNAIGLQNVGIEGLLKDKLPALQGIEGCFIANIAGESIDEFVQIAEALENAPNLSGIEVNVSCPNVRKGGMAFGVSAKATEAITRAVRKSTSLPIIVKLTPNVTDIREIARAAEAGGADAVSLINTLLGMAIDIEKRRPLLGNITGGLSGPAIRPVAVNMVWSVSRAIKIPVIGMGGVRTWEDAIEFFLAGASAISIGTAVFQDPLSPLKILDGIQKYLEKNSIDSIKHLSEYLKKD
ncbi:dihydroorotate dehydrogenase [Candidatus Sumerlaeota bacterium]|nr:dihydroorotate dehydrogenase [Candidatus Sumerlaeota bacterium]